MKLLLSLVVSITMCFSGSAALAQTSSTASISGLVTDNQGRVVPHASIKLTDKTTTGERNTVTNEEGRYLLASVAPGTYEIVVSARGFGIAAIRGVEAQVSQTVTVDVQLHVAAVTEHVIVTDSVQMELQKDDASVGEVIGHDDILRLPTKDRQVTSLLSLQPSVQATGEVSGSLNDESTFRLDGIDVSDQLLGTPFRTAIPTPAESVEEFRVTVADPNATLGSSGGAEVSLVTKRGTNQFHGSLYDYHQNAALNANSWTNNRLGLAKPALVDNRFGVSVGGPIWRKHTFFFFNYEGRRLPATEQVTRVVPTASFRSGTMKFRDASGAVFAVDPMSFDPRGLGANPQILQAMSLLPLPNDSSVGDGLNTGGITLNVPAPVHSDFGVLRMDHQINGNWSFSAKAAIQRLKQTGIGPNDPNNQVDLIKRQLTSKMPAQPQNYTVGLIGMIRPSWVNEFRVGYIYDKRSILAISPTTISGFNIPVALAQSSGATLLDQPIDVDAQRARTLVSNAGNTEISDTSTWIQGAHTLQFGGSFRRVTTFHSRDDKAIGSISTPVAGIGSNGNVSISPSERPATCDPTGGVTQNCLSQNDLGRYNQYYATLLGIVDNVSVLAVRDQNLQALPSGSSLVNNSTLHRWEFHFADTWKLGRSLTFNYGLMYLWNTPPRDEFGRQTVLTYKGSGQIVDPLEYLKKKEAAAVSGTVFNPDFAYVPIKQSGHDAIFDVNRKDFSPRGGIAWQPGFNQGLLRHLFGDRRTVVRGGYSLVYDRANTVATVLIPILSVGFGQTLSFLGPTNAGGDPFRAGVDGPIPVPQNFSVTSPIVPSKPFGELLGLNVDPKIKDPRIHSVNFTIQRELPGQALLEIGYIGKFGRRLYQGVNLNSDPVFFKDRASGQLFAAAFDAVATQLRQGVAPGSVTPQPWFENQIGAGGSTFLASASTSDFTAGNVVNLWNLLIDFVAPQSYNNQQVIELYNLTSLGRSNYNAMFVALRKRPSYGLSFELNYTFSKSLDIAGVPQNNVPELASAFSPSIDYGLSAFDRRHLFNAHWTYDAPFGAGKRFRTGNWVDHLIGGWYLAGIWQASSGVSQSVLQGFQVFGGGLVFNQGIAAIPTSHTDFGNKVHTGVAGSGGVGSAGDPQAGGSGLNLFANPEQVLKSFRPIELSKDGRTGRGALRGLPSWNLDLSVGKSTKVGEKVRVALAFDFFNVFNHVVFADPSLSFQDPANFGVISRQANTARVIQVGARIEF